MAPYLMSASGDFAHNIREIRRKPTNTKERGFNATSIQFIQHFRESIVELLVSKCASSVENLFQIPFFYIKGYDIHPETNDGRKDLISDLTATLLLNSLVFNKFTKHFISQDIIYLLYPVYAKSVSHFFRICLSFLDIFIKGTDKTGRNPGVYGIIRYILIDERIGADNNITPNHRSIKDTRPGTNKDVIFNKYTTYPL